MVVNNGIPLDIYNAFIMQEIDKKILQSFIIQLSSAISKCSPIVNFKIYHSPTTINIYLTKADEDSEKTVYLYSEFSTTSKSQGTTSSCPSAPASVNYIDALNTTISTSIEKIITSLNSLGQTLNADIDTINSIMTQIKEKKIFATIYTSISDQFAQFFSKHTKFTSFELNSSSNSISISLLNDQKIPIDTIMLNMNFVCKESQLSFGKHTHATNDYR